MVKFCSAMAAEMRRIVGGDETTLELLLKAAEGDEQVALEAFFEEESRTEEALRSKGGGAKRAGPRKPVLDLTRVLGNGIDEELFGRVLAESQGEVEQAVRVYFERPKEQEEALTAAAMRAAEHAEMYYKRPEGKGEPVMCNVYDLRLQRERSEERGKTGNSGLSKLGLGLYHSGIEVYGREFSFGYCEGGRTGVFEIPCRCAGAIMPNVVFKESVLVGYCERSRFEVEHLLRRLSASFLGDSYDIVRRNCNHFSNELSKILVGKSIPSYVNRPANVGHNLLSFFSLPASALGGVWSGVKMVKKARKRNARGTETAGAMPPALSRNASI
uniref:PPPDE domain-containing protein n=1 Tax=Hanusia phi TaxID=3032 RepID=A0A7S0HUY8_9CRYP